MRVSAIFLMFFLSACSNTLEDTYIKLQYGADEFNSKTGELTRHFCKDKEHEETVKLDLTSSQIHQIINAAKESSKKSLIIDETSGEELERICVSSFPFQFELFNEGEKRIIGGHSCYDNRIMEIIDETIYEQVNVKNLARSGCRYY